MNERDARDTINEFAARYPRKLTDAELAVRAQDILEFPGPVASIALTALAKQKAAASPPCSAECIAAIRRELEAARASSDTGKRWRIERITQLRSRLEDPETDERTKQYAREDLSDLVPPIRQHEWDEARAIADERHERFAALERAQGRVVRQRPPIMDPYPTEKSYAGYFPSLGEAACFVPRAEGGHRLDALVAQITGSRRSEAA